MAGKIALGPQKRARDDERRAIFDAQRADVFLDHAGGGHVLFDERGGDRAAADRFEAQRTCAGEQIDGVPAGAAGADEVEDRLAGAMLHWPDDGVAVIMQPSAAEMAADDPHFGLAIVVGGRCRRIGRFAFAWHGGGSLGQMVDLAAALVRTAAAMCYRV